MLTSRLSHVPLHALKCMSCAGVRCPLPSPFFFSCCISDFVVSAPVVSLVFSCMYIVLWFSALVGSESGEGGGIWTCVFVRVRDERRPWLFSFFVCYPPAASHRVDVFEADMLLLFIYFATAMPCSHFLYVRVVISRPCSFPCHCCCCCSRVHLVVLGASAFRERRGHVHTRMGGCF